MKNLIAKIKANPQLAALTIAADILTITVLILFIKAL
jgi:hypothetical protein